MKDWVIGVLAVIVLVVIVGATSWHSYDFAVEELCQAIGWQDGVVGFTGPAYCTEESPDGHSTHQCVWTDAAAGKCDIRWPTDFSNLRWDE